MLLVTHRRLAIATRSDIVGACAVDVGGHGLKASIRGGGVMGVAYEMRNHDVDWQNIVLWWQRVFRMEDSHVGRRGERGGSPYAMCVRAYSLSSTSDGSRRDRWKEYHDRGRTL